MKKVDLTGERFGRLLVVERTGSRNGNALYKCVCDCGEVSYVKSNNLFSGTSKSCGCLERELRKARITTHGLTKTRLYRIWDNAKKRCYGTTHKEYHRYGGRGITVCEEWKNDFKAFYDWALAHGYAENLTLDRIDNDGNYEPHNCQWLTRSENTKKQWIDRRKHYAKR